MFAATTNGGLSTQKLQNMQHSNAGETIKDIAAQSPPLRHCRNRPGRNQTYRSALLLAQPAELPVLHAGIHCVKAEWHGCFHIVYCKRMDTMNAAAECQTNKQYVADIHQDRLINTSPLIFQAEDLGKLDEYIIYYICVLYIL